jgi:hypothetical protein
MKQSAKVEAHATSQQPVNPSATCQYVADMALELRVLCKQSDLSHLAYLLEIVFIEANGHLATIKALEKASPND